VCVRTLDLLNMDRCPGVIIALKFRLSRGRGSALFYTIWLIEMLFRQPKLDSFEVDES